MWYVCQRCRGLAAFVAVLVLASVFFTMFSMGRFVSVGKVIKGQLVQDVLPGLTKDIWLPLKEREEERQQADYFGQNATLK